MLLKVQVQLFVPSERIFVLFCRSGSVCNCCIVLFYLTRQCLKVPCFEDFILPVFASLKANIKVHLSINTHRFIMSFGICNVLGCKYLLYKHQGANVSS